MAFLIQAVYIFSGVVLSSENVYALNAVSKKTKTSSSVKSNTELKVTSIEVSGPKKIEKDAIKARLVSKVGEVFSNKAVAQDILAIHKMGFFTDIEVFKDVNSSGVSLEYHVIEKPTVTEITYEGNEEIETKELESRLPIKPYEIVNSIKIKDAVTQLEKYYEEKGFYLARIEAKVEDVVVGETSRLVFKIIEGDKVKIKKVTLIGNNKLKDSYLKPRMVLQEAGFFSGMSSAGSYRQEAFEHDMAVIRLAYLNLGYIQVKIDRPLITVTPDKKSIYITYHINEGEQYSVGDVDFSGDLLFDKSELLAVTKIKDNGIFSVDVTRKDIEDLQAKYGDLGYAYTNVIPNYDVNEKTKIVNLTFEFEKGSKIYFGRINVTGNTKTRDKVVRRELKIREGELYHETRKRLSQENVQRLGFFDEINFKTSTPVDRPDQQDIEIVVKERNTGQLQLTAGYGNVQGFSIGGSVQQNNFRGLGQTLGAQINATKNRQDYSVSLTEPYLYDSLWSAGFELFYVENKERINYDNRESGGAIQFGHPLWNENVRGYIRYKLDKSELFENTYTDPVLFPLNTARGITSSVRAKIEYDTRNDRLSPSKGVLADLAYEYAGFLGGDLRYHEVSAHYRYFKNIFWDVVWRNNLSLSQLQSLNNNEVPFTQRYQMGGAYTLRGFGAGTVGKRIFSQNRYDQIGNSSSPFYISGISDEERRKRSNLIFGGTKQVLFQSELQFPLIKEAGLNGVFFYDIGQADDVITNTNFLSDFGLGFRWQSPLGLLRFEWGWPLTVDSVDRDSVNFEFSIGGPF